MIPLATPVSFLLVLGLAGSAPLADRTGEMSAPESAPRHLPVASRGESLPGPFPARITAVIDGDSVEAVVTIWLGQMVATQVRLRGIDAAEMNGACVEEIRRAVAARKALQAMIGSGPVLLTDVGRDKYGGRVLAGLQLASGVDAGQALLAAGHARPYQGGRRESWCVSAPIARQ